MSFAGCAWKQKHPVIFLRLSAMDLADFIRLIQASAKKLAQGGR